MEKSKTLGSILFVTQGSSQVKYEYLQPYRNAYEHIFNPLQKTLKSVRKIVSFKREGSVIHFTCLTDSNEQAAVKLELVSESIVRITMQPYKKKLLFRILRILCSHILVLRRSISRWKKPKLKLSLKLIILL